MKTKRKPGRVWRRDAAGIANPSTWQTLLFKRKAQKAEVELDLLVGTLVRRDDVDRANQATARIIQTDVSGLGRRIAPMLVGLTVAEILAAIDRETRAMIRNWKRMPRADYEKRPNK